MVTSSETILFMRISCVFSQGSNYDFLCDVMRYDSLYKFGYSNVGLY